MNLAAPCRRNTSPCAEDPRHGHSSPTALRGRTISTSDASFDDVIATTFTPGAKITLPIWVFGAIRLGQQLPGVEAVVSFVVAALTVIPVAIAERRSGYGGLARPTVGSSGNERYAAARFATSETLAAVDRS